MELRTRLVVVAGERGLLWLLGVVVVVVVAGGVLCTGGG